MASIKIEAYEGISTVSRARSGSNVATIIVSASHGLITGDTVTISGMSGTGYNATSVSVTVVNSTTFTYSNTGSSEGTTGDTGGSVFPNFTLPYSPNTVEMVMGKFMDKRDLPYSFAFMGFTSAVKSSINITLNGHFDGSTKNTNYRSLVKRINSPTLLKLYFQEDYNKFYLCTGANVQKVPTGARPLHVDYVASFFSPFGLLFDATQKSGLLNSSELNAGDMITPIEKITGEVALGVDVTIKDKNNNGFTFDPTATGTMVYSIIKVISDDNTVYIAEYAYVLTGTTKEFIKNASTSGDLYLKLNPGESLNDIFTAENITGITPTFYFRNGWASD